MSGSLYDQIIRINCDNESSQLWPVPDELELWIKNKYGADCKTLSIGIAGENLVRMASAFSETRTFGRRERGPCQGPRGSKRLPLEAAGERL